MQRSIPVLAISALMLPGCVTMAIIPPAVTSYSGAGCASAPDLAQAINLVPDRERAVHSINAIVGSATPCLEGPQGPGPYVVFAIHPDRADKTLIVGGALEARRILAASVRTLDAYGQTVRTFAPSEFFFRGGTYSVQFRPRETEAYVLVTTDPQLVGNVYSAINIGTVTTGTYAAGIYASWTSGTDQSQVRTFSYEGTATVLINDSDTEEAGS